MRMQNKRAAEDTEDRDHKRQRCTEEPNPAYLPPPTAAGHSHGAVDATQIPQDSAPPVASNSPRTDSTSAQHLKVESIPDVNDSLVSAPTCQPSKVAIPSKRRNPFGGDGPRKKVKTERYVNVRIYAQRKDLEHTDEIQCALTPDGGLDLACLSQKLKSKGCQVSQSTSPDP